MRKTFIIIYVLAILSGVANIEAANDIKQLERHIEEISKKEELYISSAIYKKGEIYTDDGNLFKYSDIEFDEEYGNKEIVVEVLINDNGTKDFINDDYPIKMWELKLEKIKYIREE